MHVRCDNQCKTGADRGNISGQPRLFECMGICVWSPAHKSESTYPTDCVLIQPQYIRLDGLIMDFFVVDFLKHF